MVVFIEGDDGGMDMTPVVCFLKLEEVGEQPTLLGIERNHIGPIHWSQTVTNNPVQGETFNPVMLRQVRLKIPEVL